jgi:hypothetical protein
VPPAITFSLIQQSTSSKTRVSNNPFLRDWSVNKAQQIFFDQYNNTKQYGSNINQIAKPSDNKLKSDGADENNTEGYTEEILNDGA